MIVYLLRYWFTFKQPNEAKNKETAYAPCT